MRFVAIGGRIGLGKVDIVDTYTDNLAPVEDVLQRRFVDVTDHLGIGLIADHKLIRLLSIGLLQIASPCLSDVLNFRNSSGGTGQHLLAAYRCYLIDNDFVHVHLATNEEVIYLEYRATVRVLVHPPPRAPEASLPEVVAHGRVGECNLGRKVRRRVRAGRNSILAQKQRFERFGGLSNDLGG